MSFLKTFIECFVVWRAKGTFMPNDGRADAILVHAGGNATDGSPGEINRFLALVVRQLHTETRLPIIAQGEIVPCLHGLPLYGYIPTQKEYVKYLNTVDVAQMQKAVLEAQGWKHPILVSYQPHIWRAGKVLKKIVVDVLMADVSQVVYDKRCVQKWMRSPWLNYPRELVCRLVWLFQGKI